MRAETDDWLRAIVAGATPLWSRRPNRTPGDQSTRQRRWAEILGSPAALETRLAAEGLTLERAACLLGGAGPEEGAPLPEWSRYLGAIAGLPTSGRLGEAERPDGGRRASAETEPVTRVPFAEILQPLVRWARRDLAGRAGPCLQLLSNRARGDLERALLQRLAGCSALALGLSFDELKLGAEPALLLAPPPSGSEHGLYDEFTRQMVAGDGFATFLTRYPVLARLLGETLEQWIVTSERLLQRLENDRALLRREFSWSGARGSVAALRTGLSDRHQGGQTVCELVLDAGVRLIYKPRGLSAETAFYGLATWLGDQGVEPRLRVPRLSDRGSYGWVEHIPHRPGDSPAGVERFHHRCGQLLALLFALHAGDIHCENLIADGEHPMVVDLETIAQGRPGAWSPGSVEEGRATTESTIRDSVLWTGLLPRWQRGPDGRLFDWSGLGAIGTQATGGRRPVWRRLGRDAMSLDWEPSTAGPELNRCLWEGREISAEGHLPAVLDGFERALEALIGGHDELLAEGGPLDGLATAQTRHLPRDSSTYAGLQARLLFPEFLRDGVDRSLELEALARPLGRDEETGRREAARAIYGAERRALERLDLPLFASEPGSADLRDGATRLVPGYFEENGLDRVRHRLERLGGADLERQAGLVRLAFHSRYWRPPPADAQDGRTEPEAAPPLPSPESRLAACRAIAEQLADSAIEAPGGAVGWLALRLDHAHGVFHLESMGDSLYSGRVGVALFLAALARRDGRDPELLRLCRRALQDLRSRLRDETRGAWELGAGNGLGGLIYALSLLADWDVDDGLDRDADRAAERIDPERISADRSFGVLAGTAGAILGLLTLAERQGDDRALATAISAGDHLLAHRQPTDTGHRAWRPFWAPRPLTGFAHGAAGTAYALLRLAALAGDKRFREAAEEAIAFEDASYDELGHGWPDLRRTASGAESIVTAWCHGAPGIGLGRLAGRRLPGPAHQLTLERAVASTMAFPAGGDDHLCCGNLGRMELLLEAGHLLDRSELRAASERLVAGVVHRADRRGHYALRAQVPGVYSCPSFFQGLSGVGYQLLRTAAPGELPSVLSLSL